MSLPEVYTCGNCVHSAAGTSFYNFLVYMLPLAVWDVFKQEAFPRCPCTWKIEYLSA